METNGSHSIATEIYKEKILRSKSVCKATGIHELWGRFLKDGFTKTYKKDGEGLEFQDKKDLQ